MVVFAVTSFFIFFLTLNNFVHGKTVDDDLRNQNNELRDSQNCPAPPFIRRRSSSNSFIDRPSKFPNHDPQKKFVANPEWDISSSTNITTTTIFLNETMPRYSIILSDIKINETLEVCLTKHGIPQETTLELYFPYSDDLDNYILYEGGGDAPHLIGSLSNITHERGQTFTKIATISACFSILNSGDTEQQNIVLFRWVEIQKQNCDFPNIFDMSAPYSGNVYPTSEGNGTCEVIILAKPSLKILSLLFRLITLTLTDESNKKLFTLINTLNGKVILEFYANELPNLKNLLIYSPAVSLILPGFIEFSINYSYGLSPLIIVCSDGQKGILASPSYSGLKSSSPSVELSQQPLYEFKSEYAFELTTIFNPIYISENEVVIIYDEATRMNHTLTSFDINESQINISGNNLKIFYSPINSLSDNYFLIEYTIYFGAPITELPFTTATPSKLTTTMNEETMEAIISDATKTTITEVETTMAITATSDIVDTTNTMVNEESTTQYISEIIQTTPTNIIETSTRRNSASKLSIYSFFWVYFVYIFFKKIYNMTFVYFLFCQSLKTAAI